MGRACMIMAFCVKVAVGDSISLRKMSLNSSCGRFRFVGAECEHKRQRARPRVCSAGAYLDLALERRLEVAEQHQEDRERQLKQRRWEVNPTRLPALAPWSG